MRDFKIEEIKEQFIDWDNLLNSMAFELLTEATKCSKTPIHILADSLISGAILFMCNNGYTMKESKEFILNEYKINKEV